MTLGSLAKTTKSKFDEDLSLIDNLLFEGTLELSSGLY